jgi:L-ascorbate metabolism protein UlaG (beta-lactamase superfamily)
MHENHVSPEEALQAFIDLGARVMIPMHYGTFKLSREPMDAPPRALLAAAQNASVANKIHILEPGMKYEA